jgi:hypothetical protein
MGTSGWSIASFREFDFVSGGAAMRFAALKHSPLLVFIRSARPILRRQTKLPRVSLKNLASSEPSTDLVACGVGSTAAPLNGPAVTQMAQLCGGRRATERLANLRN